MGIVTFEKKDRVGYITLNNPEKRNALGQEMVAALKKEITASLGDESIKVIVLKSTGDAFCAGADLGYLQNIRNYSYEENLADSQSLRDLFDLIYKAEKICISEVKGPALAGGCGLATICDFCFATPEATFGYTEARIGFVPALVMVYLQNRISGKNARELLLTGKKIEAEEAMEIGLVNKVVLAGDMENEVHSFAMDLCNTVSSSSVKYIKNLLHILPSMDLDSGLDFAAKTNAEARKSEDCIRGIDAFLNKQKLQW